MLICKQLVQNLQSIALRWMPWTSMHWTWRGWPSLRNEILRRRLKSFGLSKRSWFEVWSLNLWRELLDLKFTMDQGDPIRIHLSLQDPSLKNLMQVAGRQALIWHRWRALHGRALQSARTSWWRTSGRWWWRRLQWQTRSKRQEGQEERSQDQSRPIQATTASGSILLAFIVFIAYHVQFGFWEFLCT